jgi:hypothetical protein
MKKQHIIIVGTPDARLMAAATAAGLSCSFVDNAPDEKSVFAINQSTPDLDVKTINELRRISAKPQYQHWYEPCLKTKRKPPTPK